MMLRSFIFTVLFLSSCLLAAIDTFEFNNEQDRQRFRQLSEELRCPKCQNNNLAGSDAAIALDLRIELHKMIMLGQNDEQIKGFMVERYGEFVLYKPSVNSMTYVLWYGPFILLFIGFLVVFFIAKNRRTSSRVGSSFKQNDFEQQADHQKRLQELLSNKDD